VRGAPAQALPALHGLNAAAHTARDHGLQHIPPEKDPDGNAVNLTQKL
jgi:hypothetical protein